MRSPDRPSRRRCTAFIGIVALLAFSTHSHAADRVFRAGAYAMDITPIKFPISVNGGMADRQATAAHDRLHARCIVLDDGTTKLAIAVCDSCLIPRPIFDAAKAIAAKTTGIATTHMLMSATHTHTAPTVTHAFQSIPDEAYVKYLSERIAAGIIEANKRLAPAKIGWAVGLDQSQVFNRRWLMRPGKFSPDPFGGGRDRVKMNPGFGRADLLKPAGPIDPEVSIVSIQSPDGKPVALLANYSLHYVGGVPGHLLSADYFAAFANLIKQKIGGDDAFVGIMSNGTSADINNINFSKPTNTRRKPFEQITVVAESVAAAAHAAYARVEYHDWVSLAAAEQTLDLGVRKPTANEVATAKAMLKENYKRGPVLRGLGPIYANETVALADYPDTVNIKLQAMRIGEMGICAIPCEVFVEIGLAIKASSPMKPTFTIELANGYNGYLPTREQHALRGYETWRARSSYLEVGAADKITPVVQSLLKQVATPKPEK